MNSKIWAFVNWGVLVVVVLVAVWMVWGVPQVGEDAPVESFIPSSNCVDVGWLDAFEYQACYDAYSEMIFLKVSRGKEEYTVNTLDVSFVDLSSQFYSLGDVPGAGENSAYKISAQKNPKNINIKLDVVRDFSGYDCGAKSVFVDYCPAGTSGEGVGVSISPIDGIEIRDFVEVEDFIDFGSDVIAMDLVDKEAAWESTCKSNWDCGEWEACDGDVQRRDCKDLSKCMIPVNSPVRVQRCDGSCIESWECEWGVCKDGVSVPTCKDLNDCGTSFSLPKELSCEENNRCSPEVVCSDWSECDVDYDFVDLVGADKITYLEGSKNRLCVDKAGCIETQKEEAVCSISVDIYTKRFEKCGENYVGVYDLLDDSILAILEEGRDGDSYLNIYFDDQDSVYCDYCFDGIMNGDENDVDCGGSCPKCVVDVVVKKKWWEFWL